MRFHLIDCALNSWQARVKSTSLMRENSAKAESQQGKAKCDLGA